MGKTLSGKGVQMEQQVVIIGGGFGGLEAAFLLKELLGHSGTITLVDRNAFHYFIPSIHEIVSGKSSVESIRIPFAVILGPAGIRFMQDEVLSLNKTSKEVILRDRTLKYDYLPFVIERPFDVLCNSVMIFYLQGD